MYSLDDIVTLAGRSFLSLFFGSWKVPIYYCGAAPFFCVNILLFFANKKNFKKNFLKIFFHICFS